jgi:hypothetical protein
LRSCDILIRQACEGYVRTARPRNATGWFGLCAWRLRGCRSSRMASFFGRRDFGDPRHNFVPRVMEYEKATGGPCPFVPPLWRPQEFPGQVSYPVLHQCGIPGVAGVVRDRNDRTIVPRGSQSARRRSSSSPRGVVPRLPSPAAKLSDDASSAGTPPLPLSDRPSTRVRFEVPSPRAPMSARTPRSARRRMSAHPVAKMSPHGAMDDFTAAGVAELVKAGFPPKAALAAFLRMNGSRSARTQSAQERHVSQWL